MFFSSENAASNLDLNTQIALAFACEMYCSPKWGSAISLSRSGRRVGVHLNSEIRLSTRQKAVLEHIAEGKTNDRIARILNYSVATVKNDISAIFQYLGVTNRHDAIVEAEKRNLITPPPRNLKT